jgi:PDZ domain-containing protein
LRARITPFRIGVVLSLALLAILLVLQRQPAGYYLLEPDIAHPVAPLVHVAGSTPAKDGGELYFVDVQEEQPSRLHDAFQWLAPYPAHSWRVKPKNLIPPGSTDQAYIAAELREMVTSQQTAAAVALRYLGYHVGMQPTGVLVNQIILKTGAAGKLQPTDVIVAVNGQPTLTTKSLFDQMTKVKPGQTVTLKIVRGDTTLTERIRTTDDGGRALIGFSPAQSARIKLPRKVAIDSGNIGGPSAGLAFTLEVLRQLGRDVTHGYRVAATGTIGLDGKVGPIGGISQKTWGVRDAGAQVFLVPAGKNAQRARELAGPNLKVIPVTSFTQALHALAQLPNLPEK